MGEEKGKRQKRGFESQKLSDEDIEHHIILRLPPPALARFKCVSVKWRRRLSKPSFINQYKSRNVSLLGFLYNKAFDRVRFQPLLLNNNFHHHLQNITQQQQQQQQQQQDFSTIDILMATHSPDNSYSIVNSSNGLQLLYFSNFSNRDRTRDPFYVVRNFVTGGVTGIPTFHNVTYTSKSKTIRFLVFGFYFDPYAEKPNFTIVEITSDGSLNNGRVRSFKYNSLFPDNWKQKHYKFPTPQLVEGKAQASIDDDEYYRLSGHSTFLNGSLHWLMEPSGIVAYRLRDEILSFWINIPGDREYCKYSRGGFCGCINKVVNIVAAAFVVASTRFGRVGVTPMVSVPAGIWERVLAFDRTDAHVLYLRVKRTVFSYNIVSRETNKIFEISKDYGGQDNCLGFIIPYEFPRIPLSIWHCPLIVRKSRGCSNTGGTNRYSFNDLDIFDAAS
ncbi:hypothetical protein LguiB_001079 [Lonicera macranthoides]